MPSAKITFFPLGNADSILIDLPDSRKMLFDYAHVADVNDKTDKRSDLEKLLRNELRAVNRDYYDFVAFTHADRDHIFRASEFFYLEHALAYQRGDRIKIRELWVPAALILEEGLVDDARVLRAEARYRLKQGRGIRVFSRPDALRDWLASEGIRLEDRRHLISDATGLRFGNFGSPPR